MASGGSDLVVPEGKYIYSYFKGRWYRKMRWVRKVELVGY
jgi:hypothetical protein